MSDIGKFFHENGYYFAKGVYSPEEITAMENDFDRVVDQLLKKRRERQRALGWQN